MVEEGGLNCVPLSSEEGKGHPSSSLYGIVRLWKEVPVIELTGKLEFEKYGRHPKPDSQCFD